MLLFISKFDFHLTTENIRPTRKKSVALCLHNVCNSNPWSGHTTQTMNWNAMFHFLYSTPAQCLTATSIFAEAQMQRFFQICWRKRRVSTQKNCRVKNGNNIRFESSHDTDIDCNILRMRGILGLFQSLARFELIHLSAVVTKFFAKNGSMRNERVEKMLRAKVGIAYDSNTVPLFRAYSINYKYHQNYCPTNAVNISIQMPQQ